MSELRSQRGFSLVELLLVSVLMSIIAILALRAFGPVARNTRMLRVQASASNEIRCSVESLLADSGGAARLLYVDESSIRIKREQAVAELQGAWSGVDGDLGIVYTLDGGDLRRNDLALNTSVIVARTLNRFEVSQGPGRRVNMLIEVDDGQDTPSVTLVWDETGTGT